MIGFDLLLAASVLTAFPDLVQNSWRMGYYPEQQAAKDEDGEA